MPRQAVTAPQTITTTTETVIASVANNVINAPGQPPDPGSPSVVSGIVNVLTGTGTTFIAIRCRRGVNQVAGAQVGNQNGVNCSAAATINVPYEFTDNTGDPNGYTITIQQTGATGNATVNDVQMDVIAQ